MSEEAKPQDMPHSGGSYTRDEDGTLKPTEPPKKTRRKRTAKSADKEA